MRKNLTYPTAIVLKALGDGDHYGFDIMDRTGLPSGTVYPILRRLERAGFARSKWEDQKIAQDEGRPQRRYYEIAALGEAVMADAMVRCQNLGVLATLVSDKV